MVSLVSGHCAASQTPSLRLVWLTFVFLQSLLSGLKHRFMELLCEFLWREAVPGFGASVDAVQTLFSLQGEWGPQAVQQAGALLGDRSFTGPPGLVGVDSWRRGFLWS